MSSTLSKHPTDDLTTHLRKLGIELPDSATLQHVYEELSKLSNAATVNAPAHQIEPTELLHEAWIRITKADNSNWVDRKHFYRTAARIMRFVLIDFGRKQNALKRGGKLRPISLQDKDTVFFHDGRSNWLDLAEAIERLDSIAPRAAQVVELRFLAGLPEKQVATMLDVSERTVRNDWSFAKAWLQRELS